MYKRIVLIIVAILLLGGVAAWYYQVTRNGSTPQEAISNSVKEAVVKSISMVCESTKDGKTSKTSIKNGSVRSDITSANPAEAGSIILKDKTVYIWNAQKQGYTMKLPKDGEQMSGGVPLDSMTQLADMEQLLENSDQSCKPAIISDDLFVPPTDVTFIDASQMQPSGMQYPSVTIDPTQMQQYMDQYQQSNP